jgi:hypothetical protein
MTNPGSDAESGHVRVDAEHVPQDLEFSRGVCQIHISFFSDLTWGMATGKTKPELILSDDEREQLASLARSRALPHGIVARARVVLWSAEGRATQRLPSACTSRPLIGKTSKARVSVR